MLYHTNNLPWLCDSRNEYISNVKSVLKAGLVKNEKANLVKNELQLSKPGGNLIESGRFGIYCSIPQFYIPVPQVEGIDRSIPRFYSPEDDAFPYHISQYVGLLKKTIC